MESDVETLEAENRKLRKKQAELSSKFSDEREMVRYLHSVIKNYESFLRHEPGSPRVRKRSSYKSLSRSSSATRAVMESCVKGNYLAKEFKEPAKACVRVAQDDSSFDDEEAKSVTQFQAHECKHRAVVYSSGDEISSSECELLNASGLDTISESDFDSSFETTNDFNQAIISPEEKQQATISPADSRLIYRVPTETGTPVANSAMSKRQTLAEMKQLVDAMLQKATRYEKRVKRKAKEMRRMEIKFAYLESIAFGEESEYL